MSVLTNLLPLKHERRVSLITAACARRAGPSSSWAPEATGEVLVDGVPRAETAYAGAVSLVGQEDTLCDFLTGATSALGAAVATARQRAKDL